MSFVNTILEFIGLNPKDKPASSAPASVTSISKAAQRPAAQRPRRVGGGNVSEIYTVEMTSYKDCTEVSNVYREGVPVIVNMGALPEADAKNMLNYMLGLKEGLYGHLRRVTPKVWLLSPSNVAVNDEDDSNPADADDLLIQP
jgi:cell division inhibitor SepF